MRSLMLTIMLLALSSCAVVQTAAPTPTPKSEPVATRAISAWDGPSFKRMTIMVSDLNRTVRLWRDILGFEVVVNAPSGPDSYSYPVFNIAPGTAIRYAMVSAGPEQQRTLAFAELKGQPLQVPQSPRVAAAVINANGRLAEIIAKVSAEGLAVVPAVVLRSATQGIGTEAAFVDWDGHLIVLYEFPKAIAR